MLHCTDNFPVTKHKSARFQRTVYCAAVHGIYPVLFKLYVRYFYRRIENSCRLTTLISPASAYTGKEIQKHLHIHAACKSFHCYILAAALVINYAQVFFAADCAKVSAVYDSAKSKRISVTETQVNAVFSAKIKLERMRCEVRDHKRLFRVHKNLCQPLSKLAENKVKLSIFSETVRNSPAAVIICPF